MLLAGRLCVTYVLPLRYRLSGGSYEAQLQIQMSIHVHSLVVRRQQFDRRTVWNKRT